MASYVTAKVLTGISVISAFTAVKYGNSPSPYTYTASLPGTHQKIAVVAMNGVGCHGTVRVIGTGLNTIFCQSKTQAAVSNQPDTVGQ